MQGSFEKFVAAQLVRDLRLNEAGRSPQCSQISQFSCFEKFEI
jgi:hypothetical protein